MKASDLPALLIYNPFEEPIIPKRTTWAYSPLKLFRKCKRKYFWSRVLRLRPKREPVPLIISGAMHDGLAKWYSAKRSSMKQIAKQIGDETRKQAEQNVEFYDQEEYDELSILIDTLGGMLIGYSKVYAHDRESWKLCKRDIEVWFQVNMGSFDYKGRIDLLISQKGGRWVLDHKVISKISESYLETLPLDAQLRGYILGADKGLGEHPKRAVYNLIKKCKLRRKSDESVEAFGQRIAEDYEMRPDFYFHREPLRFNKNSIRAFEYDLRTTHAEYTWLVNEKADDPYDPREWPCSDHVCNEFYRTCSFKPLCVQGLDRGTAKLYTQYNKEK